MNSLPEKVTAVVFFIGERVGFCEMSYGSKD
jgi:hypothetical protein